jgi:tetratricopeptide (TPR) repeat protein
MNLSTCTTTPAAAEEFNRRGLARFAQGDLSGALAAFHTATQRSPDYPEGWNNSGIVRQARGDVAGALADFNQALAHRPDYPEALNNRARARQALGDDRGALADLDRAADCATGGFLATVLHNRGALRQQAGDLRGALADFDRALELDSGHVATHINRGEARKEAGDLDGALADLNDALERTPTAAAAPIYHARGGVLALRNDFQAAIADYDSALRLEPGYYAAYISRGNARYHRRDPRGLADYLTAFSLNPDGAARALLRVLLDGLRRGADEVLANCDQHLRLDERDLLGHARKGLTLALLGRADEAGPHLARLRAAAPAVTPHLERVLALVRRRDHTAAPVAGLSNAIDLFFSDPAVAAHGIFADGLGLGVGPAWGF